jgi:hypothetical protein
LGEILDVLRTEEKSLLYGSFFVVGYCPMAQLPALRILDGKKENHSEKDIVVGERVVCRRRKFRGKTGDFLVDHASDGY